MYENPTQNYDPEIYEEYIIHDTPINTTLIRLKGNNFLL